MVLSPLSEYPFPHKNGEESLKILNECLSTKEDPISLYEVAKLTYAGNGTEKNENLALSLYEKAKALNPEIGPLFAQTSSWVPKLILGATGIFAMGLIFAFSFYKSKKK